jgi:hydrogenase expression/formation protein HypD
MKYLDEYRDERLANKLVQEIERCLTRAWTIMEVCGGQTHSIVKYGIDYLLPKGVKLVHGPGCPVCVTPLEMIDKAHAIASHPEVIFCSFGNMLRVPGSRTDLFRLKSKGADVRIVYSHWIASRSPRLTRSARSSSSPSASRPPPQPMP